MNSTESLFDIWNNMKEFGRRVRFCNADGLQAWQAYKKYYAMFKIGCDIEVNDLIRNIATDKLISEDKSFDNCIFKLNDTQLDNKNEIDHFFFQHFRIPATTNYKLSIVKLAQVAYNIGQFNAARNDGLYSSELLSFYDENNLGLLSTYISIGLIQEVPILKSVETKGGYHDKYVKYKRKYKNSKRINK